MFEVQTPAAATPSPFTSQVEVKRPEDIPADTTNSTKLYASKSEDIDRSCPDPPPAPIDYYHYYLSGDRWPEPDSQSDEHFWLTSPFEGGQRLLITTWFPYGYDAGGRYLIHNGIDMAEPLGTPLLAAASGTIVAAGDDLDRLFGWRCNWYGHLVIIKLDDPWDDQPVFVLYGHVLNIIVEEGQRVERGQPLAEVGFGGAAVSPHLHLEVRLGDNTFAGTRNPLLWIAPSENKGLIVGRLIDPEGRPWQGAAVTATGVSEGTQNYTSWTYLGDPELIVNPDDRYAENFVIGDITPGTYEITAAIQGEVYRAEIIVESGAVTTVELVTKPYKTPTPAPPAETVEP
ncbi:MAG: peptidoglycan DD-metalloendopeptidase family protein [Candidatus Promineifilaceae bacterium]